jgi:hypothetical protein
MAACIVAWPAVALSTRPDRADAEYRELASKYPSSIAPGASATEAVLISPRWLLTGGPRARSLKPDTEIEKVYPHPSGAIVLVLLRKPLADVEPSPLYRSANENGRTVAFVGHGGGATRAAINTIDRVSADTIALRLKPLDEASDLQGALTADELGAPLYIEVDDEPFVAGIALDAGREWQTFARISSYAQWIDDTIWMEATQPPGRTPGTHPGARPQ